MSDVVDGTTQTPTAGIPLHRYTAALARRIETAWQERWEREGTFHAANPTGPLSDGFDEVAGRPRRYVLDMFPYPSGDGLHVGHPLGYIGTDVYARYLRMSGANVLHTMGFDAFGLPAEQYAVETGQHPRDTTEANIRTYRRQLRRLGLGHDPRRSVATTDVDFYHWTQWIFLQIFDAWYDPGARKARPVADLRTDLDARVREPAEGTNPFGRPWPELSAVERRHVVDAHRLAYRSDAVVNWCPGLGTVLANEEVTPDGRSERGNFPVYRRPLTQWMLRITAFADRLIDDLDSVDWPESVAQMQRNWIGRSSGARVSFGSPGGDVEVFTTRPDTLFGATYLVLAPEHPLVDEVTADRWPDDVRPEWTGGAPTPAEAVAEYREAASQRSDLERQTEGRDKTGVFTGSSVLNPVNGEQVPIFVADYVLMGYGSGAIMAVPAHDQRDLEFAQKFHLPVVKVVEPPAEWNERHRIGPHTPPAEWPEAYAGDGVLVASANAEVSLNGLGKEEAKARIIAWLQVQGRGEVAITYKLRDWLFSRQRYWGEPFPIVYDEHGLPVPLPESMLPVELPEMTDFSPRTYDGPDAADSEPEPPLSRLADWVEVELDLGDGLKKYHRETNTMPQWAGSCWYEIRYLDPANHDRFVDPEVERYWMGPNADNPTGGADLYVGGVEHAVLHLLYARFWQKVLYDLGHVSASEPFARLFNQGYIQAAAYTDERGFYVPAAQVTEVDGSFTYEGRPVTREFGKMGKSLKNSVAPDEMYAEYGADTLRLYEMFTGPLEQSRPWDNKAVIGVHRLLQRVWRNVVDEATGSPRVSADAVDEETRRQLHRTIAAVREGMETLRFNTAIARITELNNHLTARWGATGGAPREVVEPLLLMLAPLAPHVAEELWSRLGHAESLAWETFPVADPTLLATETVEIAVQVNGKVRATTLVPADADKASTEALVLADALVVRVLAGVQVQRVIVVPGRLVNIVTG
ncbi:leucine--tRNA ligase [Kribbella sp. NPDC002412]